MRKISCAFGMSLTRAMRRRRNRKPSNDPFDLTEGEFPVQYVPGQEAALRRHPGDNGIKNGIVFFQPDLSAKAIKPGIVFGDQPGRAGPELAIARVQARPQLAGELHDVIGSAGYLAKRNGLACEVREIRLIDVDPNAGDGIYPPVAAETVLYEYPACLSVIPIQIVWPFDLQTIFACIAKDKIVTGEGNAGTQVERPGDGKCNWL